jgi:hypothetical protein
MKLIDIRNFSVVKAGQHCVLAEPADVQGLIKIMQKNENYVYWLQPRDADFSCQIPALHVNGKYVHPSVKLEKAIFRHIRLTRNFYASGQVQQDLSRLHRFLLAETQEACAFQLGTTSLTSCGGTCVQSGFNELRLLVPITTSVNADPAEAANLRTIIYRLNGTQLLRTGPRILSSGALDTTTATRLCLLQEGEGGGVTKDNCYRPTMTC